MCASCWAYLQRRQRQTRWPRPGHESTNIHSFVRITEARVHRGGGRELTDHGSGKNDILCRIRSAQSVSGYAECQQQTSKFLPPAKERSTMRRQNLTETIEADSAGKRKRIVMMAGCKPEPAILARTNDDFHSAFPRPLCLFVSLGLCERGHGSRRLSREGNRAGRCLHGIYPFEHCSVCSP